MGEQPSEWALCRARELLCSGQFDEMDQAAFVAVDVARALDAARREGREEAILATCRYCRGEDGFSKTPKPDRDSGRLVHLTQGYPPRVCEAAAIRALSSSPVKEAGRG